MLNVFFSSIAFNGPLHDGDKAIKRMFFITRVVSSIFTKRLEEEQYLLLRDLSHGTKTFQELKKGRVRNRVIHFIIFSHLPFRYQPESAHLVGLPINQNDKR